MSFVILGVHPVVDAEQTCFLLEVEINDPDFEWTSVTQRDEKLDKDWWQVAYLEEPTDPARNRWAFFFHYLDFNKPLETNVGTVELPAPTPMPDHLRHIKYWAP